MWLDLLRDEVEKRGSKAAAGASIGYSRPSVSLALAGKYPGGTDKIEAAVLAKLAHRVKCPHLKTEIAQDECARFAAAPMPMGRPKQFHHWTACQNCPQKPILEVIK